MTAPFTQHFRIEWLDDDRWAVLVDNIVESDLNSDLREIQKLSPPNETIRIVKVTEEIIKIMQGTQ